MKGFCKGNKHIPPCETCIYSGRLIDEEPCDGCIKLSKPDDEIVFVNYEPSFRPMHKIDNGAEFPERFEVEQVEDLVIVRHGDFNEQPSECEFCKNIPVGLPLVETDLYIAIRKTMSNNELVFSNCGDERGCGALKINFCPMCGRKLEER